nr:DUF1232 domain-containing protein [Pseudobdellovibrionaceae bacterium]
MRLPQMDITPEERRTALLMCRRLMRKTVPRLPFALDVVKLFLLVRDRKARWRDLAPAVIALIYFVSPADAVPDALPGIGFMDDATLIATVVMSLGSRLSAYEP